MEVTKEKLDELIEGMKRVAKLNRERIGYSGHFVPVVIVVGPEGEHSVNAVPFEDREQKALLMKALSVTARRMNVIAMVIVTDTMSLKLEKFCERFGIPQGLTQSEFEKIYSHILDEQFEGSLANVPEELVSDALCVMMKSPLFKQSVCMLPYHESVGDGISWDKEEPQPEAQILMLDDWWDTDTTTAVN